MGHLYDSQLREVRTSIKSIYDKKVRIGNLVVKINAYCNSRYKNWPSCEMIGLARRKPTLRKSWGDWSTRRRQSLTWRRRSWTSSRRRNGWVNSWRRRSWPVKPRWNIFINYNQRLKLYLYSSWTLRRKRKTSWSLSTTRFISSTERLRMRWSHTTPRWPDTATSSSQPRREFQGRAESSIIWIAVQ